MNLHDTQGRRLYLTADERRAFIAAAATADRPVRTLCTVLHDTGCRISEALALTPESVDLSGRAVMFESLRKRRHGIYRGVPVPPALLDTFDMWAMASRRLRETRRTVQPSALVLGTQHRVAARQRRDGGCRNTGRPSPLPQRAAPRLRRPHHQLGPAAQHALEVDGPCHP